MNTNYSKIALLLALGVIAGDKVGAELGLQQRSLEDLNTPQRKNIVKNEYSKGFQKTKANLSRLAQMDKAVERILGNIESKNGHILSSRAWVGSDGVVTDLGKKILGDSNTVLETYMKHDVLVKNLRSQLEVLEKNFNKDIAEIKSKKIDGLAFFNIKEGNFKGVKEFIDASQGKDKKVSDIVKGIDGLFSNLNKVDISSSQGNQLLVDFAITLENMTDSAAELGNATVDCTDSASASASPASKVPVDLKTGLDNTVNALKDLFAHYAGRYAGCPIVQDSGNQFETMVKRHNFVSEKLSKINFASSAGMKKFLDTILGLDDRAIAAARTKLVEEGTKTTVADKDELLAGYLKSVFGEAADGLDDVATGGRVFEYQSTAGGVAHAGNQVGPDEVKYAFGLDDTSSVMGNFASLGTFKTTPAEVAKVEPLFNFVGGFRSGISDAKANSTSAVKDGRTILKAFAKSDGFAQKAPSISLRMSAESGFTTETQIKDYFSNTKKRAEQLLKENKATFDASAPAWKIELEGLYHTIDDYFVKSMSGLWGNNATSEVPGTCKGQTLDSIKRSRAEIKEAYDAAIAALGAAPVVQTQGPAAEAPKTAAAPAAPAAGTPDVNQEGTGDVKRLTDFLAQGQGKGVRKIEEKEEVNLDDIDLTALLNSQTGKLLNGDDAKEALEILNKFLADTVKSLKGDSKKPVSLKTKKDRAISIINELVDKFTEAYDGEDPEGGEDEKKQKALTAAKNKAVAAAKDEITTKVYKAFGIKVQKPSGIKAGQGSKKRMGGTNTRGRNRTRGNSRRRVQKNDTGQKGRKVENDTGQKGRKGKRGIVVRRGRTKASNKSEE